jgi:hypothetical protein
MKCPEELRIPNSKEAGEWRIRNSQEMYQLWRSLDLSEPLKHQGSDGQGAYKQMENNEIPRRTVNSELECSR